MRKAGVVLVVILAGMLGCSALPTDPTRYSPPDDCLDCPSKLPYPPPSLP